MRYLIMVVGLACMQAAALAADQPAAAPAPDKSGYWLLNPTPDSALRDFAPDRPGKAHGTTTVDAGRFQIESDFANWTYDRQRRGLDTTRAYAVAAPLLKIGVTNFMDLQVGLSLINRQTVTDRIGTRTTASGFGDTTVGAKINLFGNDGGSQSLAFLPFVKLPTAPRDLGNGKPEYSFFLPYAVSLPNGFGLTLEPGLGILRKSDNSGYRQNYIFVANLNRQLLPGLTGAIEIATERSSVRGEKTKVSLDPSLQYQLTKSLQVDVGMYFGLNKATPRYVAYSGFAYRF